MRNLVKSIVLGVVLVAPVVSQAASFTVSPNPVKTSAFFGNNDLNGHFEDQIGFDVETSVTGSSSVTNISGANVFNIDNIKAVIDGTINYVLQQLPATGLNSLSVDVLSFGTLAAGHHVLTVSGDAHSVNGINASYGGQIGVTTQGAVGAVPVPGAVWLFGSALVGLMGVSGRKKKLS